MDVSERSFVGTVDDQLRGEVNSELASLGSELRVHPLRAGEGQFQVVEGPDRFVVLKRWWDRPRSDEVLCFEGPPGTYLSMRHEGDSRAEPVGEKKSLTASQAAQALLAWIEEEKLP